MTGILRSCITLVALSVAGTVNGAVISIDLDPGTAGIQSTRTVTAGSTFGVDLVYTGDGVTAFDAVNFLDVSFNNAGSVLSLSGTPILGTIGAGTTTFDVGTGAFGGPGMLLGPLGVTPGGGFASSVGGVQFGDAFGGGYTGGGVSPIAAGTTFSLYSLTFTASSAGTSFIMPTVNGFGPPPPPIPPPGVPVPTGFGAELSTGGFFPGPGTGIFFSGMWQSALVTSVPVPEPASIAIWSVLGLVGICVSWCRVRR